ncbi:hypothetical protein Tco_1216228 [Tanacetum coccineum]
MNDVHDRWDKMIESGNKLIQFLGEMLLEQAANIDQSPPQEMSIQDMEDLKQHYLDEMLSLSNDLQIKDYRNEKIDIRFRRECESMIDELKGKFNGMSIEINKKKELQHLEQVANLSTYPSQRFNSFCYDDDDYEESTIPLNEIVCTFEVPILREEDSTFSCTGVQKGLCVFFNRIISGRRRLVDTRSTIIEKFHSKKGRKRRLTILNTLDHLGKFDGKSEEGYLLGYSTNSKGFRVYNRVTRKVQDCLHVNFLENQENQKGKGPDWMFDLDLLTPSMNYIPVRKENYADSKEQGITCDDAEDLEDQQFIVHTTQPMPPEERTAAKEVKLSSEDQALHDELVSLMHQESLAKAHNDDQRTAFEEEKRRLSIAKGKEHVDSTFNLSTANTPPQSAGNTPTDSDDDTPTDGVFSTNSFDAEEAE